MGKFITKHWFALTVLALVFLFVAGRIASGQGVVGDRSPTYLSGFLTCGTNEDGTRVCPFRLHYINLEKGRTYMIRMESSDFDTNLALEDLYGNVLAKDTDYYDTLYGLIVFRPAETARYRLVANCLTPVEGFYNITIREMPVMLNVEAELAANNSGTNERTFDMVLTAGRRYIIDMDSSHFDAFVKLTNLDGAIVAFEDECGAMRNARVVFIPTVTAPYRIIATGYAERATGPFRLVVCED